METDNIFDQKKKNMVSLVFFDTCWDAFQSKSLWKSLKKKFDSRDRWNVGLQNKSTVKALLTVYVLLAQVIGSWPCIECGI